MPAAPTTLRPQLLRYLVVGGLAVVIDAGTYYLLVSQCVTDPAWAKRVSFAAGAVWAFLINKFFTFGQRSLSLQEPLLFAVVYVGGWFLNSILHDAILRLTGYKTLAFLVATGASTCTNFAGQKWLVFRRRAPPGS